MQLPGIVSCAIGKSSIYVEYLESRSFSFSEAGGILLQPKIKNEKHRLDDKHYR